MIRRDAQLLIERASERAWVATANRDIWYTYRIVGADYRSIAIRVSDYPTTEEGLSAALSDLSEVEEAVETLPPISRLRCPRIDRRQMRKRTRNEWYRARQGLKSEVRTDARYFLLRDIFRRFHP